jgi:hypothetical protein
VQFARQGRYLPQQASAPREAIYWPDGRTAYTRLGASVFGERPDRWAALALAPGPSQALLVPRLAGPIRVDGQVLPDEWEGAAESVYRLPGGQWRAVRYGHDDENLYLGARWSIARGPRANEECALYLDPEGDGGLRPHADDLSAVLLATHPQALTVRRLAVSGEAEGEAITGAMAQISAFESQCEFAIPLRGAAATISRPGLGLAVSWDSPRR